MLTTSSNFQTSFPPCPQPISSGCTWSSDNWSCAYDCTVMSLFYAYISFKTPAKIKWYHQTPLAADLSLSFQNLISSHEHLMSSIYFNIVRDRLRDQLSNSEPVHFPRHGSVGAAVELIFEHMRDHQSLQLSIRRSCSSAVPCSCVSTMSINEFFPSILFSSLWTMSCEAIGHDYPLHNTTTQEWVDIVLEAKEIFSTSCPLLHDICCTDHSTSRHVYMADPPPLLTIEIQTEPPLVPHHIPSKVLNIDTINGMTVSKSWAFYGGL
jgi:hypothetical protein